MRMATGGNGRMVAVMTTTREILCYYPRQRGRAVALQVLQLHKLCNNFRRALIGRS